MKYVSPLIPSYMPVTSSYIDSSLLPVYPQKIEKCSFYGSVTQTGVTVIIKADYD